MGWWKFPFVSNGEGSGFFKSRQQFLDFDIEKSPHLPIGPKADPEHPHATHLPTAVDSGKFEINNTAANIPDSASETALDDETPAKQDEAPVSDLTTDKSDYAPGETAFIKLTGIEVGDDITFEVEHLAEDGSSPVDLGGAGHDPWTVTDGGAQDLDGLKNGEILTDWYVNPDDSLGETFSVTAVDSDGDVIAEETFTDAAGFIEKTLTRADGQPIAFITHMEFGPDGLLYASNLFGTIYAFDVQKGDDGEYSAILVHEIDLLGAIPNHDDDGTPRPDVEGRFVLGFDVAGTAENPVIYVGSSDPRVDTFVDSNSGVVSQLSLVSGGNWEKLDLVRGLSRSQHDHVLNGVEYAVDANGDDFLLISVPGHTNGGAPSAPLQYLPEYVLSGSVLKLDLAAIRAMPVQNDGTSDYVYNLPTLDDPTRDEEANPQTEFYGGNGGLNQAIYDPTGPLTFYSTGLRNSVEIIETVDGNFLTFDNGGNPSWGGGTVFLDADGNITDYANAVTATNLPEQGDIITSNQDQLHLLSPGGTFGTYLGHPNPIRASGADAGLYIQDASGTPLPFQPADFASVIPEELEDLAQGQFLEEGISDGALVLSSKSTNGLTEYTFDGAFGGTIVGNIFATRYGTQSLIRIEMVDLDDDGVPDTGVIAEEYALGIGGPLDVHAPGANDPFFGALFVSGLASDGAIRILEPSDGTVIINLTDRDNDGIRDNLDAYQYDAANGTNTTVGDQQVLFWDFESTTPDTELPGGIAGYRVGISGFMTDDIRLPEGLSLDRFDPVINGGDDVVLGGTANTILIGGTPGGTADGADNTQLHGFQAGFVPVSGSFTLTAEVWNPYRAIPSTSDEQQKTGAALSTGSQDSFLALMIGNGFIELIYEEDGVEALRLRQENASLQNVDIGTYLTDLAFDVDVDAGSVIARYEAETLDGLVVGQFDNVQLYGDLLDALQGEYLIEGEKSAIGWTLLSTAGTAGAFESNWGSVTIEGGPSNISSTGSVDILASGNSSFSSGFFTVTNSGAEDITRLTFTIDDTFVDEIFWDTDGSGDAGNPKPFTVDSEGGTGVVDADGIGINARSDGGFITLVVDFPDFNPGETMTFSIDSDPASAAGFGSGSQQGAISGLELAGTLVTAEFGDGSSASAELVATESDTSFALVRSDLAPPIIVSIDGYTNGEIGYVSDASQIVELTGAPGQRVAVMIGHGDTVPDDATGSDLLTPPNYNSIEGIEIRYVMLDATGFASTVIDVSDPDPFDPNDGTFRIMAAAVDLEGVPIGRMSAGVTIVNGTAPDQASPTAINDTGNVFANDILSGNVTANDFDPNDDDLTVAKVNGLVANVDTTISLPSGALLSVDASGAFTYDPNNAFDTLTVNQSASDSFFYEISDGNGGIAAAVAVLNILGTVELGDLVKAVNVGGGAYYSVDRNIAYEADTGLANGLITYRDSSDVAVEFTQDDPLYQTYAFGTFGYDFAVADGDYIVQFELAETWWTQSDSRVFDIALEGVVEPALDDIDVFALSGGLWEATTLTSQPVTVNDGVLNIDFITEVNNSLVSAIAVFEVATGIQVAADDVASVSEDGTVLIDVLANDAPGATLDGLVIGATHGTATIEDGQIRYDPFDDFFGTDNFVYVASNADGTSEATVSVSVDAMNDAPTDIQLSATTIAVGSDVGAVIGVLSATDVDGDMLTFTVNNAAFAVDASNRLVVAGDLDTLGGSVEIEIGVSDPSGASAPVLTQTIMITSEAADDVASVSEDGTVLIDVLANDTPGATLDGIVIGATHGTATIEDGQIRYNPFEDFFGTDNFIYASSDAGVISEATVSVSVDAVNDEPTAMTLSGNTVDETAADGTVIGDLSVSDVDDVTFSYSVDDARFAVTAQGQLVVAEGADMSVETDTEVDLVITAMDSGGEIVTLNETVTIQNIEQIVPVVAVNIGGEAFVAGETGIAYAADPGASSGLATYRSTTNVEVMGTTDDELYSNYAFGTFGYDFAVADGDYIVQFELAETWWTQSDSRVFDIALEGVVEPALDDIDVFALSGGLWEATTLTSQPVTVNDGVLNIDFITEVNNSLVSAIAVFEVDTIA